MPETKDSQANIAYIRTHVDNLERMVRFQISANPQSRELMKETLARRPGMGEVYLALEDRPKTQDELRVELGLSQPTLSRILKELCEANMVDKIPSPADRKTMAYKWTELEKILDVSRLARDHLKRAARPKVKGGMAAPRAASGAK